MIQSRILQQVAADDARDVLVVCDVLCEDNEGNRYIGRKDRSNIGTGNLGEAGKCMRECEVRNREERRQLDAIRKEAGQGAEVRNLQSCVSRCDSDEGEDRCQNISRKDADDERDHTCVLPAVGAGKHCGKQCYKSAQDGNLGCFTGCGADLQIADRISGQAQTDDGNGRPDDNGRHQAINPVDADCFCDRGNDDIDKTRKDGTQQQPGKACLHTDGTGEGGNHRSDKGEGAAHEYRTLALRKESIDQGAAACAKDRCTGRHAVAYNHRYGNGGGHDRQHLLEAVSDQCAKFRFVFYIVNEFHTISLSRCLIRICLQKSADSRQGESAHTLSSQCTDLVLGGLTGPALKHRRYISGQSVIVQSEFGKFLKNGKKFHQTVGNGEDVIRAIIGTIGDANAALVVPAAAEVLHDVQDCRGGCGLDGEIFAIARVPGKCLLDPCVIGTDVCLILEIEGCWIPAGNPPYLFLRNKRSFHRDTSITLDTSLHYPKRLMVL